MKKFTEWLRLNNLHLFDEQDTQNQLGSIYPNYKNLSSTPLSSGVSEQEKLRQEKEEILFEKEIKILAQKIADEVGKQGQQGKVFFVNEKYKDYPVLDPAYGTGTSTLGDPSGNKKDITKKIVVNDFSKIDQDAKNGNFKFYIINCLANTNNTSGTIIIQGAIDKNYCRDKDLVNGIISQNLKNELEKIANEALKSVRNRTSFGNLAITGENVVVQNYSNNKPPYNGNLPFYFIMKISSVQKAI